MNIEYLTKWKNGYQRPNLRITTLFFILKKLGF